MKHILFLHFTFFGAIFWELSAQVINYSETIFIQDDVKKITTSYVVAIKNKEYDWLSKIFVHEYGETKITDAFITNNKNEVVRKLKKKEIRSRSRFSEVSYYTDDKILEFDLKWDTYPYQIHYTEEHTLGEYLHVADWEPSRYRGCSVLSASLSVDIPDGLAINIFESESLSHTISHYGDRKILEWKTSFLNPPNEETHSPNKEEMSPKVVITSENFVYSIPGSMKSWSDYGNWQYRLNDGLDELPESEKAKVRELVKSTSDTLEMMRVLYKYMQDQTTYLSVDIDYGGLQPYPATYVCTNKYGDCKALTIYMKALLKGIGITAYYSKIYAGDTPLPVNKSIPGQQFNHVILAVPYKEDTIWLENTSQLQPFGYVGTFIQNRYALMVKENGSSLVKTPALKPEDVEESSIYQIELLKDGSGTAVTRQIFKGDEFETLNYISKHWSEKEIQNYYRDNLNLNQITIENAHLERNSQDDYALELVMDLKLANQIDQIGPLKIINIPKISTPPFERISDRTLPVRINYPIVKNDSIIYKLEDFHNIEVELPESVKLVSKYGEFGLNFQIDDGLIVVWRNFLLKSGNYPLEEYKDFYNFIDLIQSANQESIIVIK